MNIKIDKMRYQPNNLSYYTAFLAIAFDAYYLLTVITNQEVNPTVTIAVKVLLNIAFILTIFLAMVKVRIYKKNWSYVLFVFAVITLARIFYMPMKLISNENLSMVFRIHLFVILAIIASLLFISAIVSYTKCSKLEAYQKTLNSEVKHG